MTTETFDMQCPECGGDIEEIVASVSTGSRTERFWGAPVRLEESECDVETIPACCECGKQTVDEEAAAEHYWDRVA
jgi:rRNA maturation protein Nop10